MRYSPEEKHRIIDVQPPLESSGATHAALFERVEAEREAARRTCMLLLVGGSDRAHSLLRNAQSHLRFDAQPSRWSHAALIADWSGRSADAVGLEVTHEPEGGARHAPERNGVTPFKLARYADARRYPHLCVIGFNFKETSTRYRGALHARHRILEAALEPSRDRARYPLWRLLGPWLAYFHEAHGENPLASGVAVPSAAFCQYVFEAASIDVMPSASLPGACPELLWASALRWSEGMDVTLDIWRSASRDAALFCEPEAHSLEDELPAVVALRDRYRSKT